MLYRIELNNTEKVQSPAWPDQDTYFYSIEGGTYNADVNFWEVGTLTSQYLDCYRL